MLDRLTHRVRSLTAASVLAATMLMAPVAIGQINAKPVEQDGVEVIERLGAKVPLDLAFMNEAGQPVQLSQYFNDNGKPVVLMMIYFRCPLMCPQTISTLQARLNDLDMNLGEKFNVVLVSIDPTEGPDAAAKEKAGLLAGYRDEPPPQADQGLAVLTTNSGNAKVLADAIGFKYKYVPASNEYSHLAVTVVLTPDGTVSRYLYGVNFPATSLRFALLEASSGKIGTTMDRVISWCFHYDPQSGKYTLSAVRFMQVGGGVSLVVVGGVLGWMVISERRRRAVWRRGAVVVNNHTAVSTR